MIKSAYIGRWLLLLAIIALGNLNSVYAQDANIARAKCIYEWFVVGQGDSIYVALNKEAQGQLSPATFNDIFRQTENMFGKLKSKGEWKSEIVQGITVYYLDLEFERYKLRLLLAFDGDGRMNTIRLVPVPTVTTSSPTAAYDQTKIVERDITVGADGFQLPGTLTLPKAAVETHKVPCVILVHGSGPNDRDETIGPNKPFRDLAWGLAEQGIAVIRYDKRTKVYGDKCVPVGRQLDYDIEAVDDAVAAVLQAKALPEIMKDSIYVLGHSLGGTLAPRIAEKSEGLAGIIILAGLVRPLEDALEEQLAYIASLTNSSANAKEQLAEQKRQLADFKNLAPASYWAFAKAYKPVKVAAKLKLPILVIQGERDYQVTMEDFELWRRGLSKYKNASFKSYPKLNHLLQEGSGKATPNEYNQALPVAKYVISDIASFVHNARL